jgi:ABC-type dipeptide/oligopeptide/nickel transport system permease subunit
MRPTHPRTTHAANSQRTSYDLEVTSGRRPLLRAARRFVGNPPGVVALLGLLLLAVLGVLAPVIAPYPAGVSDIALITRPQAPFAASGHLLGTDNLGHDLLSQLLYAVRESTVAALVCAVGSALIGGVVGLLAGWYRGWLDSILNWLTGLFVVIPAIALMLLLLVYAHWPITPFTYALWLMLLLWTGVARAVRGAVISLRPREFISAAEAAGASGMRIMFRHLLPNSVGPLLVAATNVIAQSVLVVATVAYLRYASTQSEKPSLGILIAQGVQSVGHPEASLVLNPWWLYVLPGIVIALLLSCATVLADTLDDALDPRAR